MHEECSEESLGNRTQVLSYFAGFYQAITIVDEIYKKQSKYQDIQVYRTKHFGNALVLDGAVQITEKDADSYNEMMSHVPLFAHKKPKRVLIIGGGDGYVLKEVCLVLSFWVLPFFVLYALFRSLIVPKAKQRASSFRNKRTLRTLTKFTYLCWLHGVVLPFLYFFSETGAET